ncbi:hypothetical protein AB0L06_19930 [Spirillospora sp. NPDC052269]
MAPALGGAAYLLVTLYLQEVLGTGRAGQVVAPVGLLTLALGAVLGQVAVRLGPRTAVGGAATSGVAGHEQGLAGGVRQTSSQLGVAVLVVAMGGAVFAMARSAVPRRP